MKNALDCVLSEKLNSLTSRLADIIIYNATTNFNEKLDFYNKNLDFSQQDAINFSFKQKELAIIHGYKLMFFFINPPHEILFLKNFFIIGHQVQ